MIFVDSLRVSTILGVFIVQIGVAGGHRGGHNPLGRVWGPRRALLVGCVPLGSPSNTSLAQQVSSGPEKISKKFYYVWNPFGIDFM